jgi:hypothetical protein
MIQNGYEEINFTLLTLRMRHPRNRQVRENRIFET